MKVAVIGAGIAGLCAVKHCLAANISVTAFEQHPNIGGNWFYTDATDVDVNGVEVHTSCYKSLKTNLPKESMGFPDFPIGDNEASYIGAGFVMEFLQQYCEKFALGPNIRLAHQVVRVAPKGDEWELIVRNVANETYEKLLFDAVIVCVGHYTKTIFPDIAGESSFVGKIIHSHAYRTPAPFKNERVLIVGAGASAHDIALDILSVAKTVTISHHANLWFSLPEVLVKPDIQELTATGAQFVDGTTGDYSIIIYCTGYDYSFPFLSTECGIRVENNYVQPLWKHCVNINNPSMVLIGLPFNVCPSHFMDLQLRFYVKFLEGNVKWPTKAQMLDDTEREMRELFSDGRPQHKAHYFGPYEAEYSRDLAALAQIEPLIPVMAKIRVASQQEIFKDYTKFRSLKVKLLDSEHFEFY